MISETEMFTIPLNDVSVKEKETATFECKIAKDVPKHEIKWFMDDKALKESNRIKFVKDGLTLKLIIKNCTLKDEGMVTVQVGEKKSSASLFIRGLYFFNSMGADLKPSIILHIGYLSKLLSSL